MIANALRAEIDRYAVRARQQNPLFCKATDGTISSFMITRYLANVHRMVGRSRRDFARARDRALALGLDELAKHYEHKRKEEDGHDGWSANDLERVSPNGNADRNRGLLPAIDDLMRFIDRIIDEDPFNYLAYVLFAEYYLVSEGPEWLRLLEERCGVPRTSMTVIGNHIELDKGHVEAALERIDELVADPRKLPRLREILVETFDHFDQFCREVTDPRDVADRSSERHISAA